MLIWFSFIPQQFFFHSRWELKCIWFLFLQVISMSLHRVSPWIIQWTLSIHLESCPVILSHLLVWYQSVNIYVLTRVRKVLKFHPVCKCQGGPDEGIWNHKKVLAWQRFNHKCFDSRSHKTPITTMWLLSTADLQQVLLCCCLYANNPGWCMKKNLIKKISLSFRSLSLVSSINFIALNANNKLKMQSNGVGC